MYMCLHFDIMAHGNKKSFNCLYLFKFHLPEISALYHMLQGFECQDNELKFGAIKVEQFQMRCSVNCFRVEIVKISNSQGLCYLEKFCPSLISPHLDPTHF